MLTLWGQQDLTPTQKLYNAYYVIIFLPRLTIFEVHTAQCTVFRKAYILSGSSFHEFLYSMIESFKKIPEIAEFIPNQLRFHEKNFS